MEGKQRCTVLRGSDVGLQCLFLLYKRLHLFLPNFLCVCYCLFQSTSCTVCDLKLWLSCEGSFRVVSLATLKVRARGGVVWLYMSTVEDMYVATQVFAVFKRT